MKRSEGVDPPLPLLYWRRSDWSQKSYFGLAPCKAAGPDFFFRQDPKAGAAGAASSVFPLSAWSSWKLSSSKPSSWKPSSCWLSSSPFRTPSGVSPSVLMPRPLPPPWREGRHGATPRRRETLPQHDPRRRRPTANDNPTDSAPTPPTGFVGPAPSLVRLLRRTDPPLRGSRDERRTKPER